MVKLGGGGHGTVASTRRRSLLGFGTDANEGVVGIVDAVGGCIGECLGQIFRGADGAGNVVATIDGIDEHVMMVGAHMDEGRAFDISLTGTAIHATAYDNLCLHRRSSQEHQHAYYGLSQFQFSIHNSQFTTVTFGSSRSGSDNT